MSDQNPIPSSTPTPLPRVSGPLRPMSGMIFASRWLQVPLYLGLIVAQAVYVVLFLQELVHLVPILWDPGALVSSAATLGVKATSKEVVVMLMVLSLIDVVMISNLLIMVIIGGYETFVSRLGLEGHPDQPEWLSHVNANILKVKLATAIIGISSIHLLKTFISADSMSDKALLWQTIIHVTFILSAISIAWIDRLLAHSTPPHHT
jgi:uncharacterized protein (TIGR00645 family)